MTLKKSQSSDPEADTLVLGLALGIGVNSAIFSVVNAVLLRPLPVAAPHELVDIYTSAGFPDESAYGTSSYADFMDLRESSRSFQDIAGHSLIFASLTIAESQELIIGEAATWNYFPVLGLRPTLGRFFNQAEDANEGTHPVAVLSFDFWQDRFAGDPGVLGSTFRLNGTPYKVVGVGPPDFHGTIAGLSPVLWIPVMMADKVDPIGLQDFEPSPGNTLIERRGRRWLSLKGRLASNVTPEQAEAELDTLMAGLAAAYPRSNGGREATVVPTSGIRIHPLLDGALVPAGLLLLLLVGLVLLVACANVANMFLARASGRRREIALRIALGAGRGRLIRQLLTESLALAGVGGLLGLLIAYWGTRLIFAIQLPLAISLELDVSPDVRVLLFTLGLSLLTGVLFGLVPALQSTRRNLVNDLKSQSGDGGGRAKRISLRSGLVVTQVAVSLTLLVSAAMVSRSLQKANQIDVGFPPQRLAILTINLGMHGYTSERGSQFYTELLERFRSLPMVSSASYTTRLPFTMNIFQNELYPGPREDPDRAPVTLDVTMIGPDYLETLGARLAEGRVIDRRDRQDAPRVVLVNQAAADLFWPGESPLGKSVTRKDGPSYEVVGVTENYKVRTVGEEPRPLIHFSIDQSPSLYAEMLVRTRSDAPSVLESLRREANLLEPNLAIMESTTMERRMSLSLFGVKLGAWMLTSFGVFALFLASVGLYGVMAYSVAGKTREIGTRMALGARERDVLLSTVREGLGMTLVGLGVGLVLSAILANLLRVLLYGISPLDPISFLLGSAVLTIVALMAAYLPARRAARVDPLVALRYE